jgi:hypothetical protein
MSKFKVGDFVRYHPIIGREHDGNIYEIEVLDEMGGRKVAWLSSKRGCVSLKALSPAPTPECREDSGA